MVTGQGGEGLVAGEQVFAPFTDDQVKSLNAYQESRAFHPFTGRNELAPNGQDDVLIATPEGWTSRYDPDYSQNWAWAWMADWSWREFDTWRSR